MRESTASFSETGLASENAKRARRSALLLWCNLIVKYVVRVLSFVIYVGVERD